MKLNKENLEKLYRYVVEGGSLNIDDIAKFANVPDEDVKDVMDQVQKAYPKLKEDREKWEKAQEEPKETPKEVPAAKPLPSIFLQVDGIAEELDFVAQKGDKIYVKRRPPVVPTDIVTVKINGKDTEIDLLNLKPIEGLSVETLRMLGTIAKA